MGTAITALLGLALAAWVTGLFRREARKSVYSMGNTVLGISAFWVAITWLWRNRRDAVSAVAATVLAGAVLAIGGAWYLLPEWRLTITAPVVLAAIAAYVAWDWRVTGGAPLRVVLAGKREEVRVRNAVHSTHENAHVRSARRTSDGWRLQVDHVGQLDAPLVGQVVHAGDARSMPGDQLGRSTLVLEGRAGGWERFAKPVEWTGPSSTKAADPLPFAVDMDGKSVAIEWPGVGGRMALVAGATGAGKSGLVRVLVAEMAYRQDATLVLCDPKKVEFRMWRERAFVASGVDESGAAFDRVYAEMMRRYDEMPEGQVEWRRGDGNWIVLVIDELAAITRTGSSSARSKREEKLSHLLAMGRAAGVGVVACTQRPSSQVLDLDLRDNFRVRIGLGMESHQGTAMVMGDAAEKAPCHTIPESLPGACYARIDRKVRMARSLFLDPSKVREIAAETAQYKGDEPWLVA